MLAPDWRDFQCKLFISVANFIPRYKVLFEIIVPCNYYEDCFLLGKCWAFFEKQIFKNLGMGFNFHRHFSFIIISRLKFVFEKRSRRPFCIWNYVFHRFRKIPYLFCPTDVN